MTRAVRIANCSGFYGDRVAAAREMVEGGPVDVLTGDYLAELTMLILWKARRKDPSAGYARTFLTQVEQVLGTCLDRGTRIVVNAGGLNPPGLAEQVAAVAGRLGLAPRVAHVTGDDLADRLGELQAAGHDLANLDTGRTLGEAGLEPVTANAYLGGWGIAEALGAGADVVVTGRVTDASLVVGPAAWWHGWGREDWDALAGRPRGSGSTCGAGSWTSRRCSSPGCGERRDGPQRRTPPDLERPRVNRARPPRGNAAVTCPAKGRNTPSLASAADPPWT